MLIARNKKAVSEFAKAIYDGMDKWIEAGELLVDMLDKSDVTYESIINEIPEMSYDVLSRFEQIGRKQLYPKLLICGSSGLRKLATLPYSEQKKYFDEPVDVIIEKPGGVDTLKVMVKNLTPFQVKQIFNNGTIRDAGAQRSWLRSENHKTASISQEGSAYAVKGSMLVINRPCKLSVKELANLMAQMS